MTIISHRKFLFGGQSRTRFSQKLNENLLTKRGIPPPLNGQTIAKKRNFFADNNAFCPKRTVLGPIFKNTEELIFSINNTLFIKIVKHNLWNFQKFLEKICNISVQTEGRGGG